MSRSAGILPASNGHAELTGKAKVPDVAIYVVASKLQLPTYEEAFDEIFLVTPENVEEIRVAELIRT